MTFDAPIKSNVDCIRWLEGPGIPSVWVAGWAFAQRGDVVMVQVWGNDGMLDCLPIGFPRPDVASHFGSECPTDRVGFEGKIELPRASGPDAASNLRLIFLTDGLERLEVPLALSTSSQATEGAPATDSSLGSTMDDAPGAAPTCRLAAPNFFILGAAKCGTTSLHHALSQHPEIHLPKIKEPCFFSPDFQVIKNPVAYFNLFPQQEGKIRYGEASHVYFSAPETAPILRQLFPDAKFLIIVRDPANRAYSLYQHMLRAGDEPLTTFEAALAAEDARFSSPSFRTTCRQYFWNYMYFRSSCYDRQLENYLSYFPRDQFRVLTLGEWMAAPQRWLAEIFQFLGVTPLVQVDCEPKNQGNGYAPMSAETRLMLDHKFEGLRSRLEKLIGRKLDHWEC